MSADANSCCCCCAADRVMEFEVAETAAGSGVFTCSHKAIPEGEFYLEVLAVHELCLGVELSVPLCVSALAMSSHGVSFLVLRWHPLHFPIWSPLCDGLPHVSCLHRR